uniref:F-box domain-containing protein n=1 Tax=Aegilops tauschii subsp. strangulata TaxID=200361 RepID=A0A453N2Z6_AEGTS
MASEPVALPDDALAEVLRRLPPHILAEARRVCKAWRDAVDNRLRGSMLSRSVHGIFITFTEWHFSFSEFFFRPSRGPAIDGGLYFLPYMGVKVTDHCEGLLLCHESSDDALPRPREYVVNPATRRWARLPKRPLPHMPGLEYTAHLAFEPAVSPHYQVFLISRVPWRLPADGESDDDNPLLELEWPPVSYLIHVFSSVTQRWDETTFLREGEAAGIVADMQSNWWYDQSLYRAVYWQNALHIHCQHGYLTRYRTSSLLAGHSPLTNCIYHHDSLMFILIYFIRFVYVCRMSLSDHTHRVIKLPGTGELIAYSYHHLGRSSRGVYCAILDRSNRLQVWYLSESCSRIKWVLKHDTCLKTFEHDDYAQQLGRQWILQNVNVRKEGPEHKAPVDEKYDYDWNSDEDSVLDTEDIVEEVEDVLEDENNKYYFFLGFHPYKEVVFLNSSTSRGLAYDWVNSKFQDLARSWTWPVYGLSYGKIDASFPYTPCWISKFPGNELESLLEDEKLSRRKLEQESQLKEESNFTYMGEYELRKHSGRAKRVKDSAAKVRNSRHIMAR